MLQAYCNTILDVKWLASSSPSRKMRVVWDRLIRFVATDGRVLRGEPILPSPDYDIGSTTEKDQLQAKVVSGTDIFSNKGDTKVTDEIVTVKAVLGPLTQEEVPILRCIGLNYAKHSMLLDLFPVL